jgi:hypothetical protein
VRALFAVLAALGCLAGFARGAFPRRCDVTCRAVSSAVGNASVTAAADDAGATVDQARLPRSGTRRATLLVGLGLPVPSDDNVLRRDARGRRPERNMLAPRSFDPAPPDRPPRAS